MIEKLFGTIFQRHMTENALAKAEQNAADIAFLAMMTGVEMDETEETEENYHEIEEI